ncbi:MAG TPA: class I SAM-dependent methyltransferase [Candidatus Sulfotelmatobacter sp.]|jgi:SAM-dependent methyltransferase|nr:class I SAM-dependent methyltransferase [Candidatus Sulfotelmatobacter sp.]
MAHSTELYPVEIDPFFAEDLRQMERAVNYRRWQLEMVARFLNGRVLEVGGGIGNFTPQLAAVAGEVVSLEPNEYCFRRLAEKTHGLRNVTVLQATVESMESVLPAGDKFDAVVLMNVLEHIQDDHAVLAALMRRLKPGGRMVVLVPAGPWAFGRTDERLGHYRRYDKRSARALFSRLGLGMEFLRYYNFIGIWGWWWNARFAGRENQSDVQIRFFDKFLVPVISRVEKILRPPVGQSILMVGRTRQ